MALLLWVCLSQRHKKAQLPSLRSVELGNTHGQVLMN